MTRFYLSTTLLITALLMNSAVCAQAFKKGNTNLDIGLGFAAYQTTVSFTFDFLGEDFTFVEKDHAASFVLPISFEYGLSDKLGVGLELVSANYFIDDQDTTNVTDRVRKRRDDAMRYALAKALRRGLKRVPSELVQWLPDGIEVGPHV